MTARYGSKKSLAASRERMLEADRRVVASLRREAAERKGILDTCQTSRVRFAEKASGSGS